MVGLLALAPSAGPRTSYAPHHVTMRLVDSHRRSCRRYSMTTGAPLPPVDLCPICGTIEPDICDCVRICGPYLWELLPPPAPETDETPF